MRLTRIVKSTFIVLLYLSLVCGENARADLYLQAELGRSRVNDVPGFDIPGTGIAGNVSAMRIAAGYELNPRFSVEAGFVELGQYSGVLSLNSWFASTSGQDLALVTRFPVTERLSFEAFGGVLWWSGNLRASGIGSNFSGEDFEYGISAHYRLSDRFDVGVRLARYRIDDFALNYGSAMLRISF